MLLGIDSVACLNIGGDWASPSWEEADGISDLSENTDWDTTEIVIRRSLAKQGAKTVVDVGVSCKLLREPGTTIYDAVVNALRTRDTVDVLILDGPLATSGSQGIRYIAQVVKGGGSQNTGDHLTRDIVFMPFPDPDPTHAPQWADVGGGGAITYTPITPD